MAALTRRPLHWVSILAFFSLATSCVNPSTSPLASNGGTGAAGTEISDPTAQGSTDSAGEAGETGESKAPGTTYASEPSVFSSQIGETQTPIGNGILCEVTLLPPRELLEYHQIPCPFDGEELIAAPPGPRTVVMGLDVKRPILQRDEGWCHEEKGWQLETFIPDEVFYFSPEEGATVMPRHYQYSVQILIDGIYAEIASYYLEVHCERSCQLLDSLGLCLAP